MTVIKMNPINSTLKAAINYICNPENTDGKLLISSYDCAAQTADIEFSGHTTMLLTKRLIWADI